MEDTRASLDKTGGGGLGATLGGEEQGDDEWDILGGKRVLYPNGNTFSYFKKDGSGTVYYPDSRIAVSVIAGDGIPPGLYTTFFKAKGKKMVLGSFDCVGRGSVMYPSGKVLLNCTAQGGSYYEENGEQIKLWTWEKFPLKEPLTIQVNDSMVLNVVDKAHIKLTFKCMERSISFEVGAMMRRSDTYLSKVTHKGTGDSRGKLYLDATKCRASLAQSQTLRDSFKASKIDPVMPKEGSIDPRVVELANNPSKVTTDSIRNQIRVIETISSENAASLHALPYIEHEIGEDGKRRPAHTQGVDVNSSSYSYQKKMSKGWKCVQPRLNPDTNQPKRAPVLMGGRFETCTRFAAYYTKKVRLEAIKSAGFDDFIASCPQGQVVLVCCVSAAVPLASSKALALLEDANGLVWEQHGGMDTVTRKCSRKAEELPYRIVQFDIAESRILAKRYNVKAVPMYLIYYNNRLVYLSNAFTTRYDRVTTEKADKVDRMFEPVVKKAFGNTVEDVMRTMDTAQRNGSQGKFLATDLKYGVTSSGLNNADKLAKIQPFPSATIANSRKKPLLQSVTCEPGPIDAIEKRMAAVFGRTGKQ